MFDSIFWRYFLPTKKFIIGLLLEIYPQKFPPVDQSDLPPVPPRQPIRSHSRSSASSPPAIPPRVPLNHY